MFSTFSLVMNHNSLPCRPWLFTSLFSWIEKKEERKAFDVVLFTFSFFLFLHTQFTQLSNNHYPIKEPDNEK